MNSKYKYLFKNTGILAVSNFASKILIFLLVPLYTSVLSTDEYGLYDIVTSTVQILFPILTLNIVDAVMRFAMDKATSKTKIASIGIKFIALSCIVVSAVLFVIKQFNLLTGISGLEIYIILYYISYVFNQFLLQFAKGLESVKDMGIAGILSTVTMVGTNLLFLLVLRWGLVGFFIANILFQVVSATYLFIRVKLWKYIAVDWRGEKTLKKEMLLYCTPLIFTALGWWVNSTADRYVVSFICGVAANGIFSVAYKIPSIINTLQGIFLQAWQISAIKEYDSKDVKKFYSSAFKYINVLLCLACSVLIFLDKPVARFLYANDFYEAWKYVPFLLVSSVINSASGFIGPILSAQKNSKSMALSAIYGMSFNIVLNIVLVYLIGIQGATIATVVSSYVIYFVRKRATRDILIVEKYKKVLFTWMILITQAVIEIYSSYWYIEIALFLGILILNFDIVNALYQKFKNGITKKRRV